MAKKKVTEETQIPKELSDAEKEEIRSQAAVNGEPISG